MTVGADIAIGRIELSSKRASKRGFSSPLG